MAETFAFLCAGSCPKFSAAINGFFVTASGIKQGHRYKYFSRMTQSIAIKWKPLSPTLIVV